MKITKILSIIFGILTIIGVIYVLYSGGRANAGYAVIPMIFYLIFFNGHVQLQRNIRKKQ